jgi:hypothetical protein
LDVHRYNFGDITWWDRLFGTFKEAEEFAPQCGFLGRNEERLKENAVLQGCLSGCARDESKADLAAITASRAKQSSEPIEIHGYSSRASSGSTR